MPVPWPIVRLTTSRPPRRKGCETVDRCSPRVPEVVSGIGVADIFTATICSLVICEPKLKNSHWPCAQRKIVAPFRSAVTADVKPVILLFNNTANGTSVHWL